ncbi:MAG: DISARM system helicase DrmA [Pirellula sp.]|nr:DISARM system helicase DrmA [Pirellula sp.]
MTPFEVRSQLVTALQLDLVGPHDGLGNVAELLPQHPSRWYLTGFLVPFEAGESQANDADAGDDIDGAGERGGADDDQTPEQVAASKTRFPSSMGLSVLLPIKTNQLQVNVDWGDYSPIEPTLEQPNAWQRTHQQQTLVIPIESNDRWRVNQPIPGSNGMQISVTGRRLNATRNMESYDQQCQSVSVFLVNHRVTAPDDTRDTAFAFQAQLTVTCSEGFVARADVHAIESNDPDLRIADLQFRDCFEFAVGHNISSASTVVDSKCFRVRTCWIPQAEVERTIVPKMEDVQLGMESLATLKDGAAASISLTPFVTHYREWIDKQQVILQKLTERRLETAEALLQRARVASSRIERGIKLLETPQVLEAFRLANQAMAMQAKKRLSLSSGKSEAEIVPEWRPFQLAFLLMNLDGIVNPESSDRSTVDLLFFPTGGGKTEAYLGLAAFTLVLRRLRDPGIGSCGLTVLMRYTLRLLTLDQLGRAAALICALELIREQDVEKLGRWPFEIALWVGRASTPNYMGRKGDSDPNSARAKTIAFQNDNRKPSPIPLENCPWCNSKFNEHSFRLLPNNDEPTDLRICCISRHCEFSGANQRRLPIVAVDEPVYQRLPCFMIATIDKFAAMPWTGEVSGFFGKVDRYNDSGFYGPCDTNGGAPIPGGRLPPPELIIQDELHLISGPLGTIAGLYETALDELCTSGEGNHRVRPKIVASTATVRRAESQIRALFNRDRVDIFPPPGPNRRDSFFARTVSPKESNARMYLGVTGQGRSPKRVFLRTCLALMAAAQRMYVANKKEEHNPADPYMTMLGYFNSLRELGGARRLIEDEVSTSLVGFGERIRIGESESLFMNRGPLKEVLELTSRVSTDKVADTKRRLEKVFGAKEKESVDVALATNMISVGLDITRLGLMVVYGQPKTSSEYIQASSRVGREHTKPGLVVTILNLNRPRDRSHYERFDAYHESFYRHVEATSVTPFSPRAMDRALAATVVTLARHSIPQMTPPKGASEIISKRLELTWISNLIAERAEEHNKDRSAAERKLLKDNVFKRCQDLLDEWEMIAQQFRENGTALQYQREVGSAQRLMYEFLSPELDGVSPRFKKFRANRSMRDVEPEVNLWLRSLDNISLEDDLDG